MNQGKVSRPDRRILPHTYGAWFSRFSDLTEIQKQAIPLILSGADVLLCSPTSSGKTEAYAAPAAEIAIARGGKPGTVLIVSPTRALANDLVRRLKPLMLRVDLEIGRYTGEHKELRQQKLPCLTITTPEGLDSMLARRPKLLGGVLQIVIDEIHVLDNSARGDQLRILLHRLERVAKERPQRVAASATVQDPELVAARYLNDASVVSVHGGRDLRGKLFEGADPESVREHLNFLAKAGCKKVLVFCGSRNSVETLTAACLPSPECLRPTRFEKRIFAHHGSMAKDRRERTERLFLESYSGVCFATTTLEMGIDIGSVDYVLLMGVPSSVSSLMQRIGRGGRRGGVTRMGYAVADPIEAFLLSSMIRLGKAGVFCEKPYSFRTSVIAQQICVLAASQTYLEADDVRAAIPPEILEREAPELVEKLLASLADRGCLEKVPLGRYVPSEKIEREYELGRLHSNIAEQSGFEVIDRLSGVSLGRVAGFSGNQASVGGSSRRIAAIQGERILTDASVGAVGPKFMSRGRASVSLAFAREIVQTLGVPQGKLGLVRSNGVLRLVHGLGTFGGYLLGKGLIPGIVPRAKNQSGPFVTAIEEPKGELEAIAEQTQHLLVDKMERFLRADVGLGPWARGVDQAMLHRCLFEGSGIALICGYVGPGCLFELPELSRERLDLVAGL